MSREQPNLLPHTPSRLVIDLVPEILTSVAFKRDLQVPSSSMRLRVARAALLFLRSSVDEHLRRASQAEQVATGALQTYDRFGSDVGARSDLVDLVQDLAVRSRELADAAVTLLEMRTDLALDRGRLLIDGLCSIADLEEVQDSSPDLPRSHRSTLEGLKEQPMTSFSLFGPWLRKGRRRAVLVEALQLATIERRPRPYRIEVISTALPQFSEHVRLDLDGIPAAPVWDGGGCAKKDSADDRRREEEHVT